MKKILPLIFIVVSVIIELILANITYLNLLCCDKRDYVCNYKIQETGVGNFDLIIDTKDIQIQNVKIYYKEEKSVDGIIQYMPSLVMGEMQNDERKLNGKYTVKNRNTKININSENKCKELTIGIENLSDITSIDKVIINDTHIEFSIMRCLFIFILLAVIYCIKKTDKLVQYDDNDKIQCMHFYYKICFVILLIFIGSILLIPNIRIAYKEMNYMRNFLNGTIEAILNHRTNIDLDPGEQFFQSDNPYDNTLRENDALTIFIDYSYYNGKFYSYFGMAPVLLLMLPFRLITGYYLDNFVANFIFFVLFIFTFAKLYRMLIKRYVKNVGYFNFTLGFFTILLSAVIMYLVRGMVYDIVTICGMLFTMLAYILILSIYHHPKEKVYTKIFFCSICMGFMVLSKPSYICYYIFLFYLLINLRRNLDRKEFINCIKIFVMPITLMAIFQMLWNYVRFDSAFCFGDKYQLTTFNMKNLTYISPLKMMKGICQYLFTLPVFEFGQFPFIFIRDYNWVNFDFNVIMYDYTVLGIFVIPISWVYFMYRSIKKHLKLSQELSRTIFVLMITCIALLFINIRNGVAERYVTDIKIFLYTFAMIVYFRILENNKNPLVQKMFWIICIISILVTLPINITLGTEYFWIPDTNFKVYLKNIFEFWM